MNKFGELKSKILKKLNESYTEKNRDEMKEILKSIMKNKDFKEMYLFYEEIENKFIEDKEMAAEYVDILSQMLKPKLDNIKEFTNSLGKKIGNIVIEKNNIYNSLDLLIEEETLSNIDKKIMAKKDLINHLTTKKEIVEENVSTIIQNEILLNAVLANNFNILFNESLDKEQKKELSKILSLSNEDLIIKFTELKENIELNAEKLLTEEEFNIDQDQYKKLKTKLDDVLSEVSIMEINKLNYYRLTQLKDGML